MLQMTIRSVLVSVMVAWLSATTDGFQLPPVQHASKSSKILNTNEGRTPALMMSGRRDAMGSMFGGFVVVATALVTGGVETARALDMDAFVSSQLDEDTKNCDPKKDSKCAPKLTEDEALCKYGQSGEARAAACKRYKSAGGSLPVPGSQGKSLGGAYAM